VRRQATGRVGQCVVSELDKPLDFRALHRTNPDRYPFLLQSTATGPALGQFDLLFAFPGETLTLSGLSELSGPGSDSGTDFLAALDRWWRQQRCDSVKSPLLTPFHGGWFLYLGYELAAQVEPLLHLQPDQLLPTAFAVRCPAAFMHDHENDRQLVVCEAEHESVLQAMLADAAGTAMGGDGASVDPVVIAREERDAPFLTAVRIAKEYIAAGDIFQANLSRLWSAELTGNFPADDIYARLCAANPAPFAGLVRWNDVAIISSSPERLVSVRNQVVSTRPIAGTRPRGRDESTDNALSDELFAHPKERAEHVMLIDLERNDMGRVCEAGSVEVNEFMVLESYAHVHHIVSNVRGRLKACLGPVDAIRAVFPGGTITGCPKVRCMEIISELEHSPRGAYTGSIGYLNRDGSLDLNILIRTMVMRGKRVELKAGAGIVADSDPQAELAETQAKARGLLMALH
jgi:4-amino-4-deoxychorismate synthase (2-amino-4-deoxychorismate-forming) component I